MKGRNRFSYHEANQIRDLLRRKVRADSLEQVKQRGQIRNIGFYITDFDQSYSGFTANDLDRLVENGIIEVTSGTD